MDRYSLTSFYDFSTTASCGGSPIVVQAIGTGCNSAVENNSNGLVCSAYLGSEKGGAEYKMFSTLCATTPFDLSTYSRNYVVKTSYATSDKCGGPILQGTALAADSICHANPYGTNETLYIKANCNGGQPILQECSDSSCNKCKTYAFTSSSCQLSGAGASVNVQCFTASTDSTRKLGGGGNATISIDGFDNPTNVTGDVTNPYNSKGSRLPYRYNMSKLSIISTIFTFCIILLTSSHV